MGNSQKNPQTTHKRTHKKNSRKNQQKKSQEEFTKRIHKRNHKQTLKQQEKYNIPLSDDGGCVTCLLGLLKEKCKGINGGKRKESHRKAKAKLPSLYTFSPMRTPISTAVGEPVQKPTFFIKIDNKVALLMRILDVF